MNGLSWEAPASSARRFATLQIQTLAGETPALPGAIMKIGRLTVSDRASAGVYADRSGPEIENVLREFLGGDVKFESLIVPDEVEAISAALRKFADAQKCDMVVTTGGTGISARDVTPEATQRRAGKGVAGFRRGDADAIADAGEDGHFVARRGRNARCVFDREFAGQAVGSARMPGDSRAGHPRRTGAFARRRSACAGGAIAESQ